MVTVRAAPSAIAAPAAGQCSRTPEIQYACAMVLSARRSSVPAFRYTLVRLLASVLLLGLRPAVVVAQGQDSTPGERSLAVMAELLPGVYDNVNQAYFDGRRKLPAEDRHPRTAVTITRIEAPAFGQYAYLWVMRTGAEGDAAVSSRIVTLSAGPGADEVTMRQYFAGDGELAADAVRSLRPGELRRTEGCDYFFRRRAGHFRGQQRPQACRFEWEGRTVWTDNEIQLSPTSLWFTDHKHAARTGERITGVASGEPFWLERARQFYCYVDIPGVGGGRDIPFERYDGIRLHDKGGSHWLRTREAVPRDVGILLQSVTWHVLNEKDGAFNRDSLVLYAMERLADGTVKEHGYAFTDPAADRIGLNLKWMLVNCAMTPRGQVRPSL